MQAAVRGGSGVPVIETERLRLRGHRVEDFTACCALWTDPIVIRHTTGKPESPEEVWKRILRYAGLWPLLGYGFWAVEDRATGDFLGEVGFEDLKRNIQPSLNGMPEIGWVLMPRAHGKGYATEAVRAALAWGDQHFGGSKTVCLIQQGNEASIRVAQKVGYREFARTSYKEHDVIIYERMSSASR